MAKCDSEKQACLDAGIVLALIDLTNDKKVMNFDDNSIHIFDVLRTMTEFEAGKQAFVKTDTQIRIGMSGNFLRPDIDRPVLLEIIKTQ